MLLTAQIYEVLLLDKVEWANRRHALSTLSVILCILLEKNHAI
jgi:hypothetical protein